MPPNGSAMRVCTKCLKEKPETDFYIQYKHTGYRQKNCKICHKKSVEERGARNPEKVWQNKPENQERIRATARAKYRENPQKEIKRQTEWRKENPQVIVAWRNKHRERLLAKTKEGFKRYRERNPKAYLVHMANRRAVTDHSGGKLSVDLWGKLFEWQKGICPYCKVDLKSTKVHLDHLIPIALNGKHSDSNMQLTCSKCNHRKHAKDPIQFGEEMGIFIPSTQLAI